MPYKPSSFRVYSMLASRSSRSRWRALSALAGRGSAAGGWARFARFQEGGESPRRNVAIRVPELGIAESENPRIGDDGFERERASGAEFRVLAAVLVNGDVALPHAHPRDGRALRH